MSVNSKRRIVKNEFAFDHFDSIRNTCREIEAQLIWIKQKMNRHYKRLLENRHRCAHEQ